jgi:hypothetical protein
MEDVSEAVRLRNGRARFWRGGRLRSNWCGGLEWWRVKSEVGDRKLDIAEL